MNNLSRRLTTGVLLLALPLILGGPRVADAQNLTASFTYPTNGATNVNMSTPVAWTSVAGAQAYTLYLGTSLGAKDLANSGELQTLSYKATNIPAGLVYARLWTKLAGVWRYVDITFTAAASDALYFTYPGAGVLSADMTQPFQWSTVPNAQAYYLYVGSAAGLSDFTNSGETQQTQYLAFNLPLNSTLYVRLWVKIAGQWRYIDRTLIVTNTATQLAQFTYPLNGATNMNVDQPITWSTAVNADKYYLYVGTTVGAKDLVNTGEVTTTSFLAQALPSGPTLYARLWTHFSPSTWRYVDISFKASPGTPPTFTYPVNASTMDISLPFSWTTIPNADVYQLTVGTTAGGSTVLNSGTIAGTSFSALSLPTTGTFYARISGRVAGVWRYSDIVFSTTPLTASLITPASGSIGFDANTTPITWTSVPFAQKYYLYVGTQPGAKDLIDSQELCDSLNCNGGPLATSWNGLLGGKSIGLGQIFNATKLYARLWTMSGDGHWRFVDSTFTTAQLVPVIIDPVDGATREQVHQVYTFLAVTNATSYRVTVQLLCDETHACTPEQQTTLLEDSGILAPSDLKATKNGAQLSYTAAREAPQTKLLAKVYVLVNGVWRSAQVTYTHMKTL